MLVYSQVMMKISRPVVTRVLSYSGVAAPTMYAKGRTKKLKPSAMARRRRTAFFVVDTCSEAYDKIV